MVICGCCKKKAVRNVRECGSCGVFYCNNCYTKEKFDFEEEDDLIAACEGCTEFSESDESNSEDSYTEESE